LSDAANVDAVVCDLMMPVLDGVALFKQVVAQRPQLAPRFIFMTGGACAPSTAAFLISEKAPLIAKPFKPGELELLIAEVAGP